MGCILGFEFPAHILGAQKRTQDANSITFLSPSLWSDTASRLRSMWCAVRNVAVTYDCRRRGCSSTSLSSRIPGRALGAGNRGRWQSAALARLLQDVKRDVGCLRALVW